MSDIIWYLSLSYCTLVWKSLGSFMLLHMALFHSFLWLFSNGVILHSMCVPSSLSISLLTGISDEIRSVQSLSRVWLFEITWTAGHQTSLSIANSRVHSNSCPLSQWCHPAISSSVVPFSSCPQSLPASESFPVSQLLAWGGQSIGVSASASVLPKNTQDWSPSEWTGWISLQSKGLPRVFSNTTVQKFKSTLWYPAFFTFQLSHPYMTTGKTMVGLVLKNK